MANEILEVHPEWKDNEKKWRRIEDAVAGGDAIKEKGTTYLPKPSGQDDDDYAAYVNRARWYDVTDRTLVGLVGSVFRREPQIEGPDRFTDEVDKLSIKGTPWITVTREIVKAVISEGRIGVLVDRPPEQQPINVLPNVVLYSALSIRNWTTERDDEGKEKLTRVVLEEPDESDLADVQYRELLVEEGIYKQKIWRKATNDGNYEVAEELEPTRTNNTIDFIPFTFINPGDLNPDVSKPPLLGLADENVGHYQLSADYRQALFLTAQPTPWATGATENERPSRIGSGVAWFFADPNAKVGMLEFQGAGIESIRQALQDSEVRMVLLGARFFEAQKKAAEAAETIKLRFSADSATLMTISQTTGEGTTQVLRWAAWWTSIEDTDSIVQTMNDDFVALPLTPQEIEAYLKAWQAGAIAYTDLFTLLKRGDLIAEDREEEEVLSDIETTPPPIPPGEDDDEEDEEEEEEEGAQAA